MKVLMLTPWYPDEVSPNSGNFIKNQVLALAEQHQVTVISAKVNYKSFGLCSYQITQSESKSLTEYRLVIKKSLPLYNQLNHLFITCWVSYSIAKKIKPDIIHASIGFPGAFWAWALSKLLEVPYVVTEHTRVKNNFRSFFHKKLTLFGLRRAKALIAVSRSLAEELKFWAKQDVKIIPNIIDVTVFKSVHLTNSAIPQIGFLGGMNTPVKGLDILLRALAEVKEEFVLHIGGTGKLIEEYKELAHSLGLLSKCKFYGFVQYEALPEFMSRLNFFVCSSRYETFCVALVEAMASGLPVVSTKCGGPEDFVNEQNGILCAKEDAEKLRNAILKMMSAYSTFNVEEIRKQAFEKFSFQKFLGNINEVYYEVLGR